jgi:hypothetical protein
MVAEGKPRAIARLIVARIVIVCYEGAVGLDVLDLLRNRDWIHAQRPGRLTDVCRPRATCVHHTPPGFCPRASSARKSSQCLSATGAQHN